MRRLYSTFAGGWPGTGLLLMRLVIGCVLVVRAGLRLWGDPPLNITVTSAILFGSRDSFNTRFMDAHRRDLSSGD